MKSFIHKCLTLVLLFASFVSTAQPPGMVLITGTDFTPEQIDPLKTYYDITNVAYDGLQPAPLQVYTDRAPSASDDDFVDDHFYGITDNPSSLNTNYFADNPTATDYQFIFSPYVQKDPNDYIRKISEFVIDGFLPGADVYFEIDYCSPVDPTLPDVIASNGKDAASGFKMRWETGTNTLGDKDVPQVKMGQCSTFNAIGNADSKGRFWVSFNGGYGDKPFHSMAVTKFNVYGKPNIDIFSSQGDTVCVGELFTVQTKLRYKATYAWFVDAHDGKGFVSAGSNELVRYDATDIGDITFKLQLLDDNGDLIVESEEVSFYAKECCPNGAGRKTVFFDDFGRFDLDEDPTGRTYYLWDYSDILDPKEVRHVSTDLLRYPLPANEAPIGHTYSSTGVVGNNTYSVLAYLSTKYPAETGVDHIKEGWSCMIGGEEAKPLNYDHSGTPEGAALFINLAATSHTKPVYKREISNLCAGKRVFFEAWITYFSGDHDVTPTIEVVLTDQANKSRTTSVRATPVRGPWVPLTAELDIEGSVLDMELINVSGNDNQGNDLVLDDIKLMSCSAPTIELFFDLLTLAEETEVCKDSFKLMSSYSENSIAEFYTNPLFLFQYNTNPRNKAGWKNIGTPGPDPNFKVKDFMATEPFKSMDLEEGDKLYFRVVAADATLFATKNNFQDDGNAANGEEYANPDDPCTNYSTSDYIKATVACPSCKRAEFTGLKLTQAADSILCPSTNGRNKTEISPVVLELDPDSVKYQYFRSKTLTGARTALGTEKLGSDGFDPLEVDYTNPGYYTLKMWDYMTDPAEAANCDVEYTILVDTVSLPTFTFKGSDTLCDGETASAVTIELTGSGPWTFDLSTNGASKTHTATASPFTVPSVPSAVGHYGYKLTSLADKYCTANNYADTGSIDIKPLPDVKFLPMAGICADTAGSRDISSRVTVDGSANSDVKFSDAGGAVSEAGLFKPMAVTAPKSVDITATYTDEFSCTSTAKEPITVNPTPQVTFTLDATYCSYDTVDLAAAVSTAGGTFTVSPADVNIVDNKIAIGDMTPWSKYTFSYAYTAPTGCAVTVTAFTMNAFVPVPNPTVPFSVVGIDDPTVTDNITANIDNTGMPGTESPEINWIDPDGTLLSEKTETITRTHPATETKVFTYTAYAENRGCYSDSVEVPFSVSPCGATPPLVTEGYFCGVTDKTKDITVSGYKGDEVAWLPQSAGKDGFDGKILGDMADQGATYILNETAEDDYVFYVATWDATNLCWSAASTVTFHVAAEPDAKITVPADVATVCWNDGGKRSVAVDPVPNMSTGITGLFTIDGKTADPEFVPSDLFGSGTANKTLNLQYSVTKVIEPVSGKSCTTLPAKVDKKTVTIEFVPAPTVPDVTWPLEKQPYAKLKASGTAAAKSFKWMKTDAQPYVFEVSEGLKGEEYDASGNIKVETETSFEAYAVEESANGCLSDPDKGTLLLSSCPHKPPVFELETGRESENIAFDECLGDVSGGAPAVKIAQETLDKQSSGAKYVWLDSSGDSITYSNTYIPAVLSVGTHNLSAYVIDVNTATGKECASLPAEVKYEIFGMPKPKITIGKTDICLYDKTRVLKGTDDGAAITSGVAKFILPGGAEEPNTELGIIPGDYGTGTSSFTFEYTDVNGCSGVSSPVDLTFHEVVAPNFGPYEAELIKDMPKNVSGEVTFTFSGSAPALHTLLWFNETEKPASPAATDDASAAETGPLYEYVLDEQPTTDYLDFSYSVDHTVYAVFKDQYGCYSETEPCSITATNCPVPAPVFVSSELIEICDYDKANEINSLEVTAAGANWNAAVTPDPGVTLEYNAGNGWVEYTAGYKPAEPYSHLRDYEVSFRMNSETMYGCAGPPVYGEFKAYHADEPETGKNGAEFCFGDNEPQELSVREKSGYSVAWYRDGSSSLAGTGPVFEVDASADPGTYTLAATLIRSNDPQCESDPATLQYTIHPPVEAPVIENEEYCSSFTFIDSDSDPEKLFPSSSKFFAISATADVEVIWYADEEKDVKIDAGRTIYIAENDPQVTFQLGQRTTVYALAENDLGCQSELSEGTILVKESPMKPSIKSLGGKGGLNFCRGNDDGERAIFFLEEGSDNVSWYEKTRYEKYLEHRDNGTLELFDFTSRDYRYTKGDSADVTVYVDSIQSDRGSVFFVLQDTVNGCHSDTLVSEFTIGTKPDPVLSQKEMKYCVDPNGRQQVLVENPKENDKYRWFYTGERDEYSDNTGEPFVLEWRNMTPGNNIIYLRVQSPDGCVAFDSVMTYVFDPAKPEFEFEYYNGSQEIVFSNSESGYVLENLVILDSSEIALVPTSPWTVRDEIHTEYVWDIVYGADQSLRTYEQKAQTTEDMEDPLYYVGRGPDAFYNHIDSSGVDYKGDVVYALGERVTEVDGREVFIYGGVPFKYGASTVTLTRKLIGYDDKSCTLPSDPVDVFMKITTGLFIPTSLAPGHASPLVSVFKPFGHKLVSYKIWIYDNWGNTVFYSDRLEDGQPVDFWDGRDKNGNMLPAGAYIWKVDATFEDGTKWGGNENTRGKKKPTGNVMLLR